MGADGDVNWLQVAIEAPLSALAVVILYKCYRARARVRCDSECSKCLGYCPKLNLKFDVTMPGQVEELPPTTPQTSKTGSSSSTGV